MPKSKDILEETGERAASAPTGHNHLLVIAIDEYAHCPKLSNCVKDAKDLAHLLWERYLFDSAHTSFLLDQDATRPRILNAIKELRHTVGEQDNLLIYFSGHGQTVDGVGYWIPVDALPNDEVGFVSTLELKPRLDAIPSFHTFLIADACFSGALFLAFKSPAAAGEDKRSRWGLAASHDRERALDGVPGENSPFAARLLHILRRNHAPTLGIQTLAAQLTDEVAHITEQRQTPVFKPLNVKGDESGQFVFRLRSPGLNGPTGHPAIENDQAISTEQVSDHPIFIKNDQKENKTALLAKLKSQAREYIAEDNLPAAFQLIGAHIAVDRPLSNTLILLKSRFSLWKNASLGGVMYQDAQSVDHASIVQALLDLLGMLRESDLK